MPNGTNPVSPFPCYADDEWSAFCADLGDAVQAVLDPDDEHTAFLLVDPLGARHGVTLDRSGTLVVTGPTYPFPDDGPPSDWHRSERPGRCARAA